MRIYRCFIQLLAIAGASLTVLALAILQPASAKADWRQDVGTFRVGIVAGDDLQGAYAKAEPFRLALAEALGLNVEIFAAKNYRILINAQVAARIEYAIYSATAYATAWKICECVEPLVIPRSSSGSDSYKSIVIAARDGPQDIGNLADAKLTGLSPGSFAGFKFAAFELAKAGLELPRDIEFEKNGEEAVQQFLAGKFDTLIGWSSLSGNQEEGYSLGTLKFIAEKNAKTKDKVSRQSRVIWQSSAIPHRPHVIRKSLAGEAKSLLRDVLTRMYSADPVAYDSIEPVFGGGFAAARHSQFLPIIEYVNSLAPDKKPEMP